MQRQYLKEATLLFFSFPSILPLINFRSFHPLAEITTSGHILLLNNLNPSKNNDSLRRSYRTFV